MRWGRPLRGDLVAAAACGGWAAVFLVSDTPLAAAVLSPLVALAALGARRLPAWAALLTCGVGFLGDRLGVPVENQALLPVLLVAAYALGRWAAPRAALLPLAALELGVLAGGGTGLDVVFAAVLGAVPWAFGRLVCRRTAAAVQARQHAAELAARDPAALAARAVAEERGRLAGQALGAVRTAVETMHACALAAGPQLAPESLTRVTAQGREAVGELRRLLGLLRTEAGTSPEAVPVPLRRRPLRAHLVDASVVAALAVLWPLEAAVIDGDLGPVRLVLGYAVVAGVALRRVDAALACLPAAAATAAAVPTDLPLDDLSLALAHGLLTWSAAVDGRARAWAAVTLLAALAVLGVHLGAPGSEGVTLAAVALPAVAGHLWAGRDRAERSARGVAEVLRSAQEAAAERAVHEERLRLARDLHDVVSSAVGVMVLQAGAALAQRDRDPERAREAVCAVQRAGAEALVELDVLVGLLDAGAGAGDRGTTDGEDGLRRSLDALVARLGAGGLAIRLRTRGDLPREAEVVSVAHRVVQEALTNAARYAPGSSVEVCLDATGEVLVVTVHDDGPGGTPTDSGAGFGLVGLAERVRARGGAVAAGPAPGGGFTLTARLPLTPVVPGTPTAVGP
ncbi:Signal transduction histidine kinase [Geodermatophilus dictyosporus]|uniref:histidine kinase n=1 Tax=Geodermatophilus dictyosporus TaxID=1523247 RepID=A0A1I5QYB7_9ACTN|nr:histidine kinase [Geodermatophilus dictyosporus]SFP51304.1 Signal transduction histidine kinase [Geodermatophilus dictyosporus]